MILRFFATIGVGTLAVVAFWGFLVMATPPAPKPKPFEKIGPGMAMHDPQVRDVTAQPHAAPAVTAAAPPPASPAAPPPATPTPPAPAPDALSPAPAQAPDAPAPAPVQAPDATQPPGAPEVAAAPDDPAAAQPAPGPGQKHAAHCTRYRTYDAATQTYRGFDGLVHPCRT